MIEIVPDLPSNIFGAKAVGKITSSDYETVLVPAVEKAIRIHGSVRFLFLLGPEFDGYSPGAMWHDMKLGFAHLKAWKKLAVVTDHEWLAGATRVFAFAMPCPVQVFANSAFTEAVKWVSSD
ncbi:MAG: STAS/SEC14 domain-containing protein [Xanthomonadales bacterium]|nr:STAS/SEC14 domain-containing protein [Xanthomonadales bacterium]